MTRESRKLNKRDAMFICTKGAVIGIFKKRPLNEDIKAYYEQDVRNFASEFKQRCYGAEDSGDYEGGCTGGMMGVMRIMIGNIRMTLLTIVLAGRRTW